MKYGKTFILLVLAIFLFSLTGVFASEIDTPVASEDTGQLELSVNEEGIEDNLQSSEENTKLAVEENNETLSYEIDSEILTADQFTYSDLRGQIGSGGNINLTKGTYIYNDDDGDTIQISTSGVINGNGAVIDMAQSGHRAFEVIVTGVTIKNLTIKNANYNGNGGAIYFNSSGTVTNCNFTDNTATYDGGAVYFLDEGNVTNCNFTDNSASRYGGAITMDFGTVSNCNFTNNIASVDGGAIWIFSGNVENCNFTNNIASGDGGAIWIFSGNVTNCNFTDNSASRYGGAITMGSGTVSNCNFTNNKATGTNSWGGAILFAVDGTVKNCHFTGNKATGDYSYGGAIRMSSGSVENCNFTNNIASGDGGAIWINYGSVENCNFTDNSANTGGAVYFDYGGTVTNCNFTGNNATTGSAIYFWNTSATKTVSNSCFLNNRANSEALDVTKNDNNITITFIGKDNLLNAIYSRNDAEVTFTNVTYWGANGIANTGSSETKPLRFNKEAGQNITVSVVVNDEIVLNKVLVTDEKGMIVLDIIAGENYFIGARHDTDSYYTEAVQNKTNNTKFHVNVTSQTTHNKTINITAKSNIPNEVIKGKLLFILPNSTQINANYDSNGIWWVLHEFDDAGDYDINASYIGLDDVIINNATISIRYDASVDVNNKTLELFVEDTFNLNATTNPRNLPVNFTSSNPSVVTVDKGGKVVAVSEGNATVIVSVGGDGRYAENSTAVNVTVSKVPTEITVNPDSLNLFVGDEIIVIANLTPFEAGNVTFTSSDDSIVVVDNRGNVIAEGKGQAIITVSFAGNNKYAVAENKTITVNVSLNDARVTVDNDTLDLKVDERYSINATKYPDTIMLDITYTSSDNSVASVDKNGIVTAIGEGTAIITVEVGDGEIYAENSTNVTVTVNKIPTDISIANATVNLNVGDEVSTNAKLNPEGAGNLTYTSSDESVAVVKDGKIVALKEGDTTIIVGFEGNNKYGEAENKTIDVSVKKLNPCMNITVEDITEGENATVIVSLPEDATGTVIVGNEIIPLKNGTATAVLTDLPVGITTVPITYSGDDKYNPIVTSVNITVNENATVTINAENLTKYYKDSEKFTVKITDAEGQPAANKTVEITINGITYKRTTDENGTASLSINLNSGVYPVRVVVDGVEANFTVTVQSTIVSSDVVKIFRNGTQYNAIFTDANGTPLPNIKVSFNIRGIIYNRTTDKNGASKLDINLDAGDYIITAYNSVTGEMKSNTIKVISLIESDDLTKYYRNASQFVVRIHSVGGGYVGAGEEVNFNINGVIYTRLTNATGHAKLNINLHQGNYTITTYYDGCRRGNNIEVLPILTAEDLSMKYMDGSQFKTKLVDGKGNPYPNRDVTFNVNGVFYNRATDSGGVAKLNIRLMAGVYIITSSYNGCNISNKITIWG